MSVLLKPLALIVLALCPFALAAEKVTACTSTLFVPFNWETTTSLEGATIEVAKRFFKKERVELELLPLNSWARCLKLAESGKIDLVLGAYKTTERQLWGDYIEEFIALDIVQLFKNKNKQLHFEALDSLQQFRGGGIFENSYGESFDTFIQNLSPTQWQKVARPEQVLTQLAFNRIDYAPMNRWNMEVLMFTLKQQDKVPADTEIIPIGKTIHSNELYFLFSKKAGRYREFHQKMNAFIKDMKSRGEIQKLLNKSLTRYKQEFMENRQ
ncbi:substrate-binding periplasmic protein [Thalassomonas actiniarum]|uniref:Transporter substrate-binding domain-containing protein n=1 Tax=Thalassomonas actiniarum TaxID=485447 RepID=A0AAE9YNC5_9GAMM|nr:transporter substrate-binding domain-containing protein [Thalassomonas actiniarum]WDD97513.1 transporter substrate-binding domain-containing protein [Thalassomonas actiniarum]